MPLTSKHKGDACEMLVAAELTLAGIPAMKMPDNWPHYDVIAQPEEGSPQRISVKARAYRVERSHRIGYRYAGDFEWLAAVILMPPTDDKEYQRYIYFIPRTIFEERVTSAGSRARADDCYCAIDQLMDDFADYRDNFQLSPTGKGNGGDHQ